MWKQQIDINQVVEIRAKTTTFFGVGAIHKIADIASNLLTRGIHKTIIVTGKTSHIKSGVWAIAKKLLDEKGIEYILYSEVTPNPTVDQVDEATKIARNFGATAVIGIGGGSPIDVAKSTAVLLSYPEKTARDLYEYKFEAEKAVPIVAINLTHGTGTETDRFAVSSIPEKQSKPAIGADCIYPLFSINDPSFMTMLPVNQTAYVAVDAICHAIEGATTNLSNPFAICLAKEAIAIIAQYLPIAQQNSQDLTARYYLLYASMIAGISFDNGLLHLPHALEHPLSGVKPELAHGRGLGIILPAVIKYIYPAKANILAHILKPIVPDLSGIPDEAPKAYEGLKGWLNNIGIPQTLAGEGFSEENIDHLTELTFETSGLLLSLSPIEATTEVIKAIYKDSL